ncbi:MAG TPA: ZIP family metal transporter [Actinomycetota bacterium]|jgi:zinc and cadmium transporter|nr:ZIP family metal transporter [Actinomycetota bacterium]
MNGAWAPTLGAVGIVSALSAVGAVTLVINPRTVERALLGLIAFAAGALLGDAFIHLLPEMAESESGFDLTASFALLAGVISFFVLEKVLHWHHAHYPREEHVHPVAVTNLVGDAMHNFVDGSIVAASFLASTKLGIATSVAVALHEIPQELGDFAIFVRAGLKPRRALVLNLFSALAAVVGAVVTLVVASSISGVERILVPITAGAFVYIASTDLLPELHKEPELGRSLVQLFGVLAGVGVMALMLVLE